MACPPSITYYNPISSVSWTEETSANISRSDPTYTIPEDGLYTLILGSFTGSCDSYYIVQVTDKNLGSGITLEKSQYKNSYTEWLSAGSKLEILTRYTSVVSSSHFKMIIRKY